MWRDSLSVQAERLFCLPAANHAYAFPSPFVSNLFISVFAIDQGKPGILRVKDMADENIITGKRRILGEVW